MDLIKQNVGSFLMENTIQIEKALGKNLTLELEHFLIEQTGNVLLHGST